MKTFMNRMALIATGAVVLGSVTFRSNTIFAADVNTVTPTASRPIPPPCRLELPRHVCREVPRPLVRTTTDPPAVR
jgi:hypothetical protein